jgi:hypothetical protein
MHLFKGILYVFKEQWNEGIAECSKAAELNLRYAVTYVVRGGYL